MKRAPNGCRPKERTPKELTPKETRCGPRLYLSWAQFDLRDPIQPLVPKQAPRKPVLLYGSLELATESKHQSLSCDQIISCVQRPVFLS